MVNTTVSRDDTLPAFLAARARSASDGRLVLDIAVGLIGALAVAFWHAAGWAIPFSVTTFLVAFGGWGIADREITERAGVSDHWLVRALRIARVFAIVIGGLAAAVAGFAILRLTLGTWIS